MKKVTMEECKQWSFTLNHTDTHKEDKRLWRLFQGFFDKATVYNRLALLVHKRVSGISTQGNQSQI